MEAKGIIKTTGNDNCIVNTLPGKAIPEPLVIPEKRGGIASCGWGAMIFIGIVALIFLLCIFLAPSNIFPVYLDPYANAVPLVPQGKLQVYPNFDDQPNYLLLPPKDLQTTMDSMQSIIKDYSVNHSNPYVKCWLQNPSYDHPCLFDINWLDDSLKQFPNFGYTESNGTYNPIAFLRIENTGKWDPIPYRPYSYLKYSFKKYDPGYFRLSCRLKYADDCPKLRGIRVFPDKGYSRLFFPQSTFDPSVYLSPIVFVQAEGLRPREDVAVVCNILVENAMYLEDNGEILINFKSNQ